MTFSSRALRPRALQICCVALLTISLAACGGSDKKAPPSTPVPAPTTSATPTPSPPPKPAPINPYTGGKPSANGVVAVKIDDTGNGRPQVGINQADIVYIEQVEGGLTRLLAVYNTTLPLVEPVRSTRASDPELMAQFGPIAYVASGGAPNPLQVLARSSLKADIYDAGGPGFARDNNRPAPYNLTANLGQIAQVLKPPKAKSIGFTFSSTTNLAKQPVGTSVRTMVGSTPVQFQYDKATKRYDRLIDGVVQHTASGAKISTPNVIVQFCQVAVYPQDVDVMGNPSQYTHTIGKGKVVVFRNGHQVTGTWSRATATSGTTLRTPAGSPIDLAPGGEWVVLVATGAPLG